MEGAKLVVEVEAKIDNLRSGLNQARATVKDFATSSNDALKQLGQSLAVTNGKVELFGNNIGADKAKLSAYTTALNQLLASGMKPTSKEVLNVANNIDLLTTRIARQQVVLDWNTNKYKTLGKNLKEASSSIGSFGVSATKGLSALRSLAYILPGIGIAGIFNLGFEAIVKLVDELDLFKRKLSDVDQAAKDFRANQVELIKVRQEGESNAQKEIVSLDVLYRATQNLNLSHEERIKAVNILQDKYPAYLKNISDEDFLAGKAANSYLILKDAIIAKALAQAKEDDIAKKAIENDKLKFRQSVINLAIDRKRNELLASQANVGEGFAGDPRLAKEILDLEKEQARNQQTMVRNNSTIALLSKEIDQSIEKSGVDMLGLSKNTAKVKEELKNVAHEVLKDLPNASSIFTGQSSLFNQLFFGASAKTPQGFVSALTEPFQHLGTIAFQPLQKGAEESFNYIGEVLIPQLTSSFSTFFDDILMHGKLNFEALGKAIIDTFASVLASDAAAKIGGLLGGVNSKGEKLGSGKDNIFNAGKGILGTILPIAGIAAGAIGLGSLLFGHKNKSNPAPASSNPIPVSSGSGSQQVVIVQAVLRGRDLVMALNLEGYYLSRVQQNGRGG